MAVAVEVDEAEVRVVPVDVGELPEGRKGASLAVGGALVEAGDRARPEVDQVELAVAGEVQELLAPVR